MLMTYPYAGDMTKCVTSHHSLETKQLKNNIIITIIRDMYQFLCQAHGTLNFVECNNQWCFPVITQIGTSTHNYNGVIGQLL